MSKRTSDDARLPSGAWAGFYCYGSGSARHRMKLDLCFRDGRLRGDGRDDVGLFVVTGRYDPETGEVRFVKTYRWCRCCRDEGHEVLYFGFADHNGVWGTWELVSGFASGGFRIWPGPGSGDLESEVEAEVPAEAVVETPRAVGMLA